MSKKKKRIPFPKWLPKSVAKAASRRLSTPHNPETKRIIISLSTREEMRPVWKKLSSHSIQPEGFLNIIDTILSSIDHWDFMEEEGLLLTPKERQECLSEITDAIDNLRRVLKKHHLHIWDYDPDTLSPIDMELDSVEQGLEYTFFWREFPTKINADSAKRTFLGRRLINFIDNHYQKQFDTEIATILNLIFDADNITDSNIRKLREDM